LKLGDLCRAFFRDEARPRLVHPGWPPDAPGQQRLPLRRRRRRPGSRVPALRSACESFVRLPV
jgi:hypothetical protein